MKLAVTNKTHTGYGAHFLTFAATFQPFSNAIAAYSPDGTQTRTSPLSILPLPLFPSSLLTRPFLSSFLPSPLFQSPKHPQTSLPSPQTETPEFASSFAFYALFMGLLSFIYLICSLRTNLIFVFVFTGASLGFVLAAASFWTTALGMIVGATLLKGAGGAFFVAAVMGWYLLAAIMFATLDLPWGYVFFFYSVDVLFCYCAFLTGLLLILMHEIRWMVANSHS